MGIQPTDPVFIFLTLMDPMCQVSTQSNEITETHMWYTLDKQSCLTYAILWKRWYHEGITPFI